MKQAVECPLLSGHDDCLIIPLGILQVPNPCELKVGAITAARGQSDQLEVLQTSVLRTQLGTQCPPRFPDRISPYCTQLFKQLDAILDTVRMLILVMGFMQGLKESIALRRAQLRKLPRKPGPDFQRT